MFHQINILFGFVLDLIFGDPYTFPHPVRFIGKYIEILEEPLRKISSLKIAGILLTVIVVITAYFVTLYFSAISIVLEIFIIYTIFSTRTLSNEAMNVYSCLKSGDLNSARIQISYLVSRDTDCMKEEDIIRATVETISENIVDGIISPLFYLFIGGAPLGMAYKAASTLDSMVGYKNETYIDFGWASARLDDVLNFIPARITAVLIPFAALFCGYDAKNSFRIALRDRHKHSSPNSAYSEAAVAGAIGCQLGGPASYFGQRVIKPYIGDRIREVNRGDIIRTIRIMYFTSFLGLVLGCFVLYIVKMFFT
ncbi:MAG: cobalamin biosynthesis protein CobD [Spirochaetes bacterium]|nr:cobalamin biosynthesis protein CobD [Spirochaetota bacterium]